MFLFYPSLISAVPRAVPPSLPVPARDPSSSTSLIRCLQPANPPAAPVIPSTATSTTAPGPQTSRNLPQHSSPAIRFFTLGLPLAQVVPFVLFFFSPCFSREEIVLCIKTPSGLKPIRFRRACLGLPHGSNIFDPHNRMIQPLMDLGRLGTERPNPSVPMLETVVRSYSDQLTKLYFELTSAISQVTEEMGELKISSASTTSTLTFLASQLARLSDLLARKVPAPAPEPNPAPPQDLLASPAPVTPEGEVPGPPVGT